MHNASSRGTEQIISPNAQCFCEGSAGEFEVKRPETHRLHLHEIPWSSTFEDKRPARPKWKAQGLLSGPLRTSHRGKHQRTAPGRGAVVDGPALRIPRRRRGPDCAARPPAGGVGGRWHPGAALLRLPLPTFILFIIYYLFDLFISIYHWGGGGHSLLENQPVLPRGRGAPLCNSKREIEIFDAFGSG